jgi:hypothetical protein
MECTELNCKIQEPVLAVNNKDQLPSAFNIGRKIQDSGIVQKAVHPLFLAVCRLFDAF